MNVAELILDLAERNVHLEVDGEHLSVRAPKGVLGEAERRRLAEHKGEVLEFLRRRGGSREEALLPLSKGQETLWFLSRMAPESPAYNVSFAARVVAQAKLDEAALRQAFERLVERHASLRTTFTDRAGRPAQRVQRQGELFFETVDATAWTPTEVRRRLEILAHEPFELEQRPPLRIHLFRRTTREAVLLITVHHIICDLWSLGVMLDDLRRLYPAARGVAAAELPPLGADYGDFVRWQKALIESAAGEAHWRYWRQALLREAATGEAATGEAATGEAATGEAATGEAPRQSGLPLLDLPTDRPHPPVRTHRGGVAPFRFGRRVTRQLRAFAAAGGTTLYTVLLALYEALLQRWSGQDVLLVGTITAGRGRSEFERLVGYLINPVPLRADFAGRPSFEAFLAQTRRRVLAAIEHQDFPFALLVERLQPERDPSRPPIFQVAFLLEQQARREHEGMSLFTTGQAGGEIDLGELTLESLELEQREVQYELLLMFEEAHGELRGALFYNADLFDATTMARFCRQLGVLAGAALARPAAAVDELEILPAAERHQVLLENNDTGHGRCALFHQLFEEWADRAPEAPALIDAEGQLSYRELDAAANRLAHRLRAAGVGPERIVGLFLERSAAAVTAVLAIMKAGGVYLPLDPEYPEERLRYVLGDAEICLLVTEERFAARLPLGDLPVLRLDAEPETSARENEARLDLELDPDHLAYVIYTSGSTGRPKGVLLSHRGLRNMADQQVERIGIGEHDRVLQFASTSFDASIWELCGTFRAGAALCVPPRRELLPGPACEETLRRYKVSMATLPPSVLALLRPAMIPSLRTVVSAGEALSAELAARWRGGETEPGRQLINAYGPTETTVCASLRRCASAARAPDIGRPLTGLRLYVLDRRLRPQPLGARGELLVGGIGLARGYHRRLALTAERFVPDPFTGRGERLYKTGDLARMLADGTIEFLGRLDHQVKVRGFRIEVGEIEATLERHAGVREAVVVLRGDETRDPRLVAYVVPRPAAGDSNESFGAADLTSAELREHLSQFLPEYMLPAAFVFLERVPMTPNGKVDRRALPVPARPRSAATGSGSALERLIAGAWREVLEIAEVGLDDNFFELGGHSLLIARLHAALRESTGRELSMVDLFTYPTVRSLARHLEEDSGEASAPRPRPTAAARPAAPPEIAVVGMSGRFPGARGVAELWGNLAAGRETITVSRDDAGILRAGGVLDDVELFDAEFFGINPREAELMDPQHRLFLETAWEAFEHAGHDPRRHPGAVGVFAGAGLNTYLLFHLLGRYGREVVADFNAMIGNEGTFIPSRVSYKLDLKGPSFHVQTACSTSLVATALACDSLVEGRCDMALAGGVTVRVPQELGCHLAGGVLSPEGRCRAFDAGAQGTVGGNGVGAVVLKRLADARADGDTIYAVIRGWAVNNDGALKAGYTAPSVDGQAEVIAGALAMAGLDPSAISYVEAHGSGTPLGDPIEVAALEKVFSAAKSNGSPRALGSVKTNVGHLDAAAGVTGLIKTACALHHRQLPPSLHFEKPNPAIDFDRAGFRVVTELEEWRSSGPLRAGVSSFGIGGTNAHLVLEEAPPPLSPAPSRPLHLLPLSARSKSALLAATGRLERHLAAHPELDLADVAYTLQVGRRAFEHRLVLVSNDVESARRGLGGDPAAIAEADGVVDGRAVAFMFPGLGDHYPGMAAGLYRTEEAFRRRFDQAAEFLVGELELDLRQLLYGALEEEKPASGPALDLRQMLGRAEPPASDEESAPLDSTPVAHAAIFVIEWALAGLWMDWGVRPRAMIGYSLGEIVVAAVAGVLELEDALRLVVRRARLIDSTPRGAMLAVPLAASRLEPWLGDELSLAAVNGPELSVVSGPEAAIAVLEERLAAEDTPCRRLAARRAFHSRLMEPLREDMTELVGGFALRPPRIAYLSNVSGDWITPDQATDPAYWGEHACRPVRFAEGLENLLAEEAADEPLLLEVGPGRSLASFALQHPAAAGIQALSSLRHDYESRPDQELLLDTLGQLWLAGVEIDWRAFNGAVRRRLPLPTYPFERQRFWVEPPPTDATLESGRASAGRRAAIEDWFYLPAWAPAALPDGRSTALEGRRWLLFVDHHALGGHLERRLTDAGHAIVTVHPGEGWQRLSDASWSVGPRLEDYRRLVAEAGPFSRVAHLWSLEPAADLAAATRRGLLSLIHLGQALAEAAAGRAVELTVLSRAIQEVEPGDRVQPEKAPLLAACRVLPQEYPNITCRHVDLDVGSSGDENEELVGCLLEELAAPLEPAVAWRGLRRFVQIFEPAPLPAPEKVPLRRGGVYLITGGTGRLGLALAGFLAGELAARLVLIARTPLPTGAARQEWLAEHGDKDPTSAKLRTLEALEEAGAEILTLAADVADEAAMRSALERAEERFGALDGVVHAAGVVGEAAFSPLAETDEEVLERHFGPKAHGVEVLRRVLGERELDFLLLTSSLSPVLGGLGFTAYAAANSYLDAFARCHRRPGQPWISVNWADWDFPEERESETAAKVLHSGLGATLEAFRISPAQGVETFRRILVLDDVPQVVVSSGDLEARLEQWVRRRSAASEAATAPPHPARPAATTLGTAAPAMAQERHARPRLPNPYVAPRDDLERAIAEVWGELLGIAEVGVHDNFFQSGGHSLVGTQLVSRLRSEFGVDVPLRVLFEAPTVAALAETVGQRRSARPEPAAALPTIVPRPDERFEPFPLTDIQEAYWVGRSGGFELGNVASHGYLELEAEGLDVDRLERAWQRVIERHDMLRAVFLPDGRQQVLERLDDFTLGREDLSNVASESAEQRLAALRDELSHQVLPADRAPLFEMRAVRLGDGRHRLLLSFDLLIGDVRSLEILFEDLARAYREPDVPLPALELSFRDCVLAERTLAASELYERARAYWQERLAGLPPAPELPLAANPEDLDEPRFARRSVRLGAARWQRLRDGAARLGVTPAALLMSVFSEILARWSRKPRFTLNLTLFNRLPLHPQIDQVVGDFTSLDMLEVDAKGATFEDRVRRLQERLWEDLDHRYFSGVEVLRELTRGSDGARARMPIVFTSNLGHAGLAESELEEILGRKVYSLSQTPQVWIDHQVLEEDGGLTVIWDAVEGLFPPGLLDNMVAAEERLLELLADDAEAWRRESFALLPADQLDRRRAFNDTAAPESSELLHTLFTAQAAHDPDAVAVIDGERQVSYGELERRSRHEAQRLLRHGARRGRLVAVLMEKGWRQVVAVLGILRAGAAYLPVDPRLPAARVAYLLEHSKVELALTEPAWHGRLELPPAVDCRTVEDLAADELEDAPLEPRSRPAGEDPRLDLAYTIFTSGSTGSPKGVMIDHRGAVNTILDVNRRFAVGRGDRVLALSALGFDLSVYDVFGLLAAGGTIVMPESSAPDPARWAAALERWQITLWNSVPAQAGLLVEYLEGRGERLPPSLRRVLMSGDWIPVDLPGRIRGRRAASGGEPSEIECVSLGGATEASIWSIFHVINEVDPAWTSIPYGRPLANQRFHVLDDVLEPCPDFVPGQLYIAGIGLALGYLGDEEKTRASFFEHPHSGERLYRTGDLGRFLPSGEIEFLGREDFQVKIRGFRVELGEIETQLRAHESVQSAVVEARGERTNRVLVAYVVAVPGARATADELRRHLAELLPDYMVPGAFVFLGALPLTANGKVDRRALPDPDAASATAEPGGTTPAGDSVPAASGPARRIAELVAEVLGLEDVDPQANLLQLGASSVDLIRIANAMEQELGQRPKLDELYLEPSINALVRAAGVAPATVAPGADLDEWPQILDPGERAAFKGRDLGRRRFENGHRRFGLAPSPVSAEERRRRFIERSSRRQFVAETIPAAQFGDWLSHLGRLDLEGDKKYLYGSAGGLYPVQLYLCLEETSVEGLPGGTYYYDPAAHQLISIQPGAVIEPEVHSPFVNRPIFEASSFSLFLVADLAAIAPLYAEQSLHYATLEAGLMTQLLEMEAPDRRIGLCQIGELRFEVIRPLFELTESHVLVHSLVGGRISVEQLGRWSPGGGESRPQAPTGDEREEVVI